MGYEEGDELDDRQLKKLMDALEVECQRCDEREDELELIICDASQGDFARTIAMSKLIHNDAEWHGYLWCIAYIQNLCGCPSPLHPRKNWGVSE